MVIHLAYPYLSPSQILSPKKVTLKGFDGNPLNIDSKVPYSPKKTCGTCHDYTLITNGYHFQQGRTDGQGKIIISDSFDPLKPFNLSSGMYGKYSPALINPIQLARKANQHPSEIDKSSFLFVKNCGVCHPGGGFGEYDRRGNPYFDEENKKFGYQISVDNPLLDGDYTPFNNEETGFRARWNESGPSEADCLICHLKGYQWRERGIALKKGLFKYGPTIGAGWGSLKTSEESSRDIKIDIDYTKKDVSDFENLHTQIVKRPHDENCLFCHSLPRGNKMGHDLSNERDVHKERGMDCVSCHPGNKAHNFAKGDAIQITVRDDLDNTMYSCEDCHERRKHRKAPRHRHPFSPRHMKRIACQTCHIPFQTEPADLVYDHASTGETKVYETSRFLSNDPINPKNWNLEVDLKIWYPAIREYKGRIVPVNSIVTIYWGDLDEKRNLLRPIFLWKVKELIKPTLNDDDGDGIPEINSTEEIKAFLIALKGKDRFGNPIAINPVLVKGEFLYRLDRKGVLERVKYEQTKPFDFSISHGVVKGPNVIGSRGCIDCHSKNSPFFLRKILVDPYDEKGKPIYVEVWERLGIDKDKLNRLLMEQ